MQQKNTNIFELALHDQRTQRKRTGVFTFAHKKVEKLQQLHKLIRSERGASKFLFKDPLGEKTFSFNVNKHLINSCETFWSGEKRLQLKMFCSSCEKIKGATL